jgi:DNA-binding response OmpR family regulator
MRVLVVDDDPIVLQSCRRILEEEGVETTLSSSVRDALTQMASRRFDVALVDVKMPDENGFSIATHAKGQNGDATPLVIMTGYPTKQVRARSFEVGAADFIAKPFTPDELLASIRRIA